MGWFDRKKAAERKKEALNARINTRKARKDLEEEIENGDEAVSKLSDLNCLMEDVLARAKPSKVSAKEAKSA